MHDFEIENLVLDAAPLLSTASTSSASSLRGMAKNFITTPDVIAEIRDKTSRELFATTLQMLGLDNDEGESGGLQVKEPPADAIAKVTAFSKLTGDFTVLSQADIRVLALSYALEVEVNGTRRLRDAPGRLSQEEQERETKKRERIKKTAEARKLEEARKQMEGLSAQDETAQRENSVPTASTSKPEERTAGGDMQGPEDVDDETPEALTAEENEGIDPEADHVAHEGIDDKTGAAREDSDTDDGEWITPSNVKLHQSRDLGLFPSLPSNAGDTLNKVGSGKGKQRTVLKVACLTGDFAMQNVALQMGLNIFGVGGKKIQNIKTWVLRCHACFKICKDPTRKFCPSCGNPSLLRTSITYVTPSPEHPQGYILHLRSNFQYRTRGTQFSIPSPKQGSSNALKNSANAEMILREDQKEWTRGVRRAEIAKSKQEKASAKAMKEGRGNAVFGGMSFDDPDWAPDMLAGEKGRSGGPAGARIGKDGLPIIGYGRRNPNASRGKRK